MSRPRLALLEPDTWPDDMKALAEGPLGALNVMKVLMHHPDLFRRWSVFANHFLFKGALPARAREILILRVAWQTACEYEWSQHVVMSAKECGFAEAEFAAIQAGPTAPLWNPAERALLRVADTLIAGPNVGDRDWDQLRDHWDAPQAIETLALVGNYVMLAMALNALAVPPDPGYPGFGANPPPTPTPNVTQSSPLAPRPPPRIEPLSNAEADRQTREILAKARGQFPTVNIIDTLAHHPNLLRRWLPFFNHCLHKQTLDPRQRELVILRTGWLAGSAYEWSQHVPIALTRGVTPDEVEAIQPGSADDRWRGADKAILESVEALMARFTLTDTEWRRIATQVTPPKAIDLMFTVGQYRLVAGLLKGLNVQFDAYLRFPPLLP